jgi:hypothetical protein
LLGNPHFADLARPGTHVTEQVPVDRKIVTISELPARQPLRGALRSCVCLEGVKRGLVAEVEEIVAEVEEID